MTTWQEITHQTIDGIDLPAEYQAMGVEFSGITSASGWQPCKVFRSDEKSPSAGVCLSGDHPQKGRYKEHTGESRNLSFFDFCVLAGKFPDWKAARDHYRKQLGIKAPRGKVTKDPNDSLAFRAWNDALVRTWCVEKPPIAFWAVRMAGGRLAGWPKKSQKFTVIALPVFGEHGADDEPIGWVIYNKSGKMLPLFQGKGVQPRPLKMLSVSGSKAGWMNKYALTKLSDAEVVWKVEGPSDMLALQSVIPQELLEKHVVLANSGGSMELPREDCVAMLAGKTVYVVHDCDQPGQDGGRRWAQAIASVAKECRHVKLPYEITENHGKDLRDWHSET